MLTHYTNSIDNVVSILRSGFIFVPNTRGLLAALLEVEAIKEQPCRGMVCFTEITPEDAVEKMSDFGKFGVAMKAEWCALNNAKKVHYLGTNKNSVDFRAAQNKFQSAYPNIDTSKVPRLEDWLKNLAANKREFAKSFGAEEFAALLDEYEYYQTDEHWSEHEWRIMRSHEFSYSEGMDRADLIETLKRCAAANRIPTLRFDPQDVAHFVCPGHEQDQLNELLPENYRCHPIYC